MKVYILLANGFEEVEALTPWDILKRAGAEVSLVSVSGEKYVTGSHGLILCTDMPIDKTNDKFDMVFLPGGKTGTENLAASEKVKDMILKADSEGRFVAAICAAPSVLGKYGLLRGKKATCFPGWEDKLDGAVISDLKMVRDGNYITGRGMGVSQEFGYLLVEVLYGKGKAEQLKKQTQFE
jgi:4-methyl-5(b-hydroxyethyl)-thiazole monophosphate biosynthesis